MTNSEHAPIPGSLRPAIEQSTRHALATGALHPIETTERVIEDAGVRFVVRSVASLEHKSRGAGADRSAAVRNPFLHYEPALFVADVSATHVALLNKFPVISHHLLIVTRAYEPQEALLTPSDFRALAWCMEQLDGLAFYNGGPDAGASQPHKHLQIVPLPLHEPGPAVPIEAMLASAPAKSQPDRVPDLPFRHSFVRLDRTLFDQPGAAAAMLAQHYRMLCAATGVGSASDAGTPRQALAYNLLLTREWMLVVPRCRESVAGISINALGFAGSLFVKSVDQVEQVVRLRPMAMLQQVALA